MGIFNFRKKHEQREAGDAIIKTPNDDFSDAMALLFGSLNQNGALALGSVHRSVELIADSVAVLPIRVCSVDETGHKSALTTHPLLNALNDKNALMTKYNLIYMLIKSVLLKGNGFAYITRNSDGSVKSLRFLESGDVSIHYNQQTGKLFYTCPIVSRKHIEPINMIHLIKDSNDGVNGLSVVSSANRIIKTANKTENSALNFFDSGCNLSGVLKVQGPLNPQQKTDIAQSWARTYSNGGGGVAVLPGNMEYQQVQSSMADAQLLESRVFNVQEIARYFGINPTLLGDLSQSSYSTLEASQQEFLVHTLQPYIVMLEQEFTKKCLKPSESTLIIDLDENYLLKTDKTTQANYYTQLLNSGVLSINEVRKELGFSEIENGDDHRIPYTDVAQNTVEDKESEPNS